jgi:hypothetical protein
LEQFGEMNVPKKAMTDSSDAERIFRKAKFIVFTHFKNY